jgi:hypothetical protein
MGINDCITSDRPDTPAAHGQQLPLLSTLPSNASAEESLNAKKAYLIEHQVYQAAVASHALQVAHVKRWDRAFSMLLLVTQRLCGMNFNPSMVLFAMSTLSPLSTLLSLLSPNLSRHR